MIKEIKFIKRINSNKSDKIITIQCDECKLIVDIFSSSFIKGEERHQGIHLCKKCSNTKKYKCFPTGENSIRFKGGISPSGYRRLYYNGKNCYEHRIVAEKKLNRSLMGGEEVHHINGAKLDNSINNIYIFKCRKEHRECHAQMERLAISLLYKKIWFDHVDCKYTTKKCAKFNPEEIYGQIDSCHVKKQKKVDDTNNGYIYKFGTNRAIHIFIIELIIKRKLYRDEVVHHIDGDKQNNDVGNLFLTTRSGHKKMHESLWICLSDLYNENIISFCNGIYFINEAL